MIKRLVIAAAVVTTFGSALGVASAAPTPSVCVSGHATVNGMDLPIPAKTCLPPTP